MVSIQHHELSSTRVHSCIVMPLGMFKRHLKPQHREVTRMCFACSALVFKTWGSCYEVVLSVQQQHGPPESSKKVHTSQDP